MADTSDLIEITQVRSVIGAQQAQRRTLRALGLRGIRQTVQQPNRPEIRGMLAKVAHLVAVRYPGDDAPLDLQPGQEPERSDDASGKAAQPRAAKSKAAASGAKDKKDKK